MHWPPSPEEYRQMLGRRKELVAELLQLEIQCLELRRAQLRRKPTHRLSTPVPAQKFLDEIAIIEQVNPKDPRIPELRLRAAAADAYGWSHKTAIRSVRNALRKRTRD